MPSYSQQISDAWRQQYGRDVNLNDPQEYQRYTEFARQMLGQLQQRDQAAYDASKRRWGIFDKLAMGAALSGLTAGALSAFSGPAGAATLPSAATEGIAFDTAPLLDPAINAASLGGPAVTSVANSAASNAANNAANTASNTARGVLGGLSARDLAALGLTAVSTIGQVTQNRPNMNPTTATTDPNLQKLMQTMQGRLDASEPLYRSILSMANGLLPTQYQNGAGYQAPTQTGQTTTGTTTGGPTPEDLARLTGGR